MTTALAILVAYLWLMGGWLLLGSIVEEAKPRDLPLGEGLTMLFLWPFSAMWEMLKLVVGVFRR